MLNVRVSHTKPLSRGGPIHLRTANPFALASALRLAMRRAGADQGAIERQVEQVLSTSDGSRRLQLCEPWVRVDRN